MMTEKTPIYLDYNATAPIRPEVIGLMQDIMAQPGNASAAHGFGRTARSYVEKAREQLAAFCNVTPGQVTFNSGATEANNTVLNAFRNERILISAIEHISMLEPVKNAEKIPVTADGIIDEAAFEAMLDEGPAPALISIMMVNNETGAIQPVEKLARIAKKKHPNVFFHTDAVQASAKMKLDMPAMQIDYLSLSSHKIGGPQGVGALILAPGARPTKILYGSGQEKQQRAGTENVAGIAGFGHAADIAESEIKQYGTLKTLRDRLEQSMADVAPQIIIYAKNAPRVPNVIAFSVPGTDSQTILMGLDLEGMAISRGTACGSGVVKPSHVIQAMTGENAPPDGALRVSMGWQTQESDIDAFIDAWKKIMARASEKQSGEMAAHA